MTAGVSPPGTAKKRDPQIGDLRVFIGSGEKMSRAPYWM